MQIFQLSNGHKLTVDDFICSWLATKEMNRFISSSNHVNRQLLHADLGCGCGSVLMHIAWAFPPKQLKCIGIEAQKVSHSLCSRGIQWNLGCVQNLFIK